MRSAGMPSDSFRVKGGFRDKGKDESKEELEVVEEDSKQLRESLKAALVEEIVAARSTVYQACDGVVGGRGAPPIERMEEAFDTLLRCSDGLISQFCDAEHDATRKKLKAQSNWFNVKLETARVAAETRIEHAKVEVRAVEAAKFDQKMRALTDGAGSIEEELMQRVEDLKEDVKKAQGIMASSAKRQLDIELASIKKESSLREVVAEFLAVFGDVGALKEERDELIRALEKEKEGREQDRAAREAAEKKAKAAVEECTAAREAEAKAVHELTIVQEEAAELKTKLDNAEARIEALEGSVKELKERCQTAEKALADAQADIQRLTDEVEALKEEVAAVNAAREKDAAEIASLRETEARLTAQVAALTEEVEGLKQELTDVKAELEKGADKVRELEERLSQSEAREQAARQEIEKLGQELQVAREEARKLEAEKKELEARCAAAEEAARVAAAEAERKLEEERKRAEEMEKQLNGRIAELEAECARLQSEAAKAAKLEAELAEEKQRAEQLRGRIEVLERRSAEADALEADLARVRQEFEACDRERKALLSKLEGFVGKDANQIAQEAENKRASLEKELNNLQDEFVAAQRESKEKRTALVDSALKSLMQMSHHMVWMLAGLKLGPQARNDPPITVKSLGGASSAPLPRKFKKNSITADSPGRLRRESPREPVDVSSSPILCVGSAKDEAEKVVERQIQFARGRLEVIEGEEGEHRIFHPRPPPRPSPSPRPHHHQSPHDAFADIMVAPDDQTRSVSLPPLRRYVVRHVGAAQSLTVQNAPIRRDAFL